MIKEIYWQIPLEDAPILILVETVEITFEPRGGGRYHSGGERNTHRKGGRPVRDAVRTP